MLSNLLLIVGGFVMLLVGAQGLVRGASSFALRIGLSPLVVGLTVAAFGTSSPELVTSIQATLDGRGAISVGNVIGSNIANVALILGVAAVIRPIQVQVQLVRWDVPLMIGCSVLMTALLLDGDVSRLEGGLLVLGLVVYTVFTVYQARRSKPQDEQVFEAELPEPSRAGWVDALMLIGGLVLLVIGADLLVRGAVAIAQMLAISEAVIGLTIIALGTSLPELATSAVASIRDESDLAVGNVVGSNVFNILGILGTSALIYPILTEGIRLADLLTMTAVATVMLPLMWTGFRLTRREGLLLLAVYGGYLYSLAA